MIRLHGHPKWKRVCPSVCCSHCRPNISRHWCWSWVIPILSQRSLQWAVSTCFVIQQKRNRRVIIIVIIIIVVIVIVIATPYIITKHVRQIVVTLENRNQQTMLVSCSQETSPIAINVETLSFHFSISVPAVVLNWIMVCSLLAMEPIRARTTGWWKTPGELAGECRVTLWWAGTKTTSVESPQAPAIRLFKSS